MNNRSKLIQVRNALGFTQKQVASQLGTTQGVISRLETGETNTFGRKKALKLVELYQQKITLSDIYAD